MGFRASSVSQLKSLIPDNYRRRMGSDIYSRYVKLRTSLIGAKIGTFGTRHAIEYALIENGRKERLVFLHGFADCKENFFDSAHLLKGDYDILIPDLPGFGKSFKKKSEVYDLANYASWLGALFDELGWTDFHLVGNSLGGGIAIELAVTRPQLVKSLTLIDPAGVVLGEHESIYHEFLNDRIIFEIHSPLQFNYFLNRVFHKPPVIPPFVRDHLYKEFSKHSIWNRKILFDLLEGITSMDDHHIQASILNDELKLITAPTMVFWGDKDSFFPPLTGHFIKREIPNCHLQFLHGLGHSPQNEAPLRTMNALKKFLKQLPK